MHKLPGALLLLICVPMCVLQSCFDRYWGEPSEPEIKPEAFVPVYGVDSAHRVIRSESPQQTLSAGKIYTVGKRLYQVENNKGIHVIDYSNVQLPVKLAFISIYGCSEVAVRNNVLLTNNLNDLVSVDISDLGEAKEIARVPGAFKRYYNQETALARPAQANVYYVCPDPFQGDVIGWRLEKNVSQVYCKTY